MDSRHLAIGLGLAFCTLAAAAQTSDAMLAPLLSKDPERPMQVRTERVYSAAQIQIQPREVTGTPKDLPRTSRDLKVASFVHRGGSGPVTLVIDYAAFLVNPSIAGEGTVSIGIECPETPNGCSYPITTSVLPFQTAFMAKQEVETPRGQRTIVVGRDSHSYTLPADAKVDLRIALMEPVNLEPLELKARLIYGEYDRRALPGQTTKIAALWFVIGGAIVFLLAAFFWLRRS